jgi:hypothetical protein
MATYRYLTTDLLTNTVIAELPLTGVTWGQALNDAGQFQGHMMLSDSRITNVLGTYNASNQFTLDYVTTPAKVGLYVERDGVIVWGGVIWSRQYDSLSQTMSLGAREFDSYLQRRRFSETKAWVTGTDQSTIVKYILDAMNNAPYGNIGIDTSAITAMGRAIPNVFVAYDYQKLVVFDVIKQLSQQSAPYGFDFSIDCAYDSNKTITRTFNVFYPRKGVAVSANYNNPMLEFPSVMLKYAYPEDGANLTNRLYGFGAGSSEGQYISTVQAASSFGQGYPLLEDTYSYTQVPDPRMVDALTAGQVAARSIPVVVLSASWFPTNDTVSGTPVAPNIGDFQLGDFFRIRITDDRFPNTLDTALRLSKFDVAVGDNGSAEVVSGSFVIPSY